MRRKSSHVLVETVLIQRFIRRKHLVPAIRTIRDQEEIQRRAGLHIAQVHKITGHHRLVLRRSTRTNRRRATRRRRGVRKQQLRRVRCHFIQCALRTFFARRHFIHTKRIMISGILINERRRHIVIVLQHQLARVHFKRRALGVVHCFRQVLIDEVHQARHHRRIEILGIRRRTGLHHLAGRVQPVGTRLGLILLRRARIDYDRLRRRLAAVVARLIVTAVIIAGFAVVAALAAVVAGLAVVARFAVIGAQNRGRDQGHQGRQGQRAIHMIDFVLFHSRFSF